jgi:hypothetical protein
VERDIPRVNEKGSYVEPGAMGGRLGDGRAEEAVEREGEELLRA